MTSARAVLEGIMRMYMRWSRGLHYLSFIQTIFIFATFFRVYGLDEMTSILASMSLSLLMVIIGYIDEKKLRMWGYELNYGSKMNPMWIEMDKKIDMILELQKGKHDLVK